MQFTEKPQTPPPRGDWPPAGFWLRFFAALLDGLIIPLIFSIPIGIFVLVVFSAGTENSLSAAGGVFTLVFFCLIGIAGFLFPPACESSRLRGTPGKWLLGIAVENMAGGRTSFFTALLRNLAKIISGIILGIGFLMAAFTREKQALHDILSSCYVTKDPAVSGSRRVGIFVVSGATALILSAIFSAVSGGLLTQAASNSLLGEDFSRHIKDDFSYEVPASHSKQREHHDRSITVQISPPGKTVLPTPESLSAAKSRKTVEIPLSPPTAAPTSTPTLNSSDKLDQGSHPISHIFNVKGAVKGPRSLFKITRAKGALIHNDQGVNIELFGKRAVSKRNSEYTYARNIERIASFTLLFRSTPGTPCTNSSLKLYTGKFHLPLFEEFPRNLHDKMSFSRKGMVVPRSEIALGACNLYRGADFHAKFDGKSVMLVRAQRIEFRWHFEVRGRF